MARTIRQYVEFIGQADATNCGDAEAAANVILHTLGLKYNGDRSKELANALQAYAYLLQQAGVTQTLD